MAGRIIHWLPRVLAILFILFISLFALDVFTGVTGLWSAIQALLIHLIPSFLLAIALVIAWRWESLGGMLFLGLGVFFLLFFQSAFAALPALLIGLLFLLDRWYQLRAKGEDPVS